jgi:5-methylcytosine-specific restriction endonuclease McrA
MERVVVLNGDFSFLNVIPWQRAICMVIKGKAEVLKYSDKVIKIAEGKIMQIPLVLKLIKIVRMIYRTRVPFSKRNVMIRDGYKCTYCGSTDTLTIDHVIPISRNGKSDFDNCVTCCKTCNAKKKDRTPSEAKMYMKKKPYSPTISEFIKIRLKSLKLEDYLIEMGVY